MPRAAGRRATEQVSREAAGIDPAELAQRIDRYGSLKPRKLRAWLLAEQLATVTGSGLLAPTARTLELSELLDA